MILPIHKIYHVVQALLPAPFLVRTLQNRLVSVAEPVLFLGMKHSADQAQCFQTLRKDQNLNTVISCRQFEIPVPYLQLSRIL